MNIQPLNDQVVVEPDPAMKETASGLVLPETAQSKSQKGIVIAAGPGRWNDTKAERVPMQLKVGDLVLFQRFAGVEYSSDEDAGDVKGNKKKCLLMREVDVFGVIA